MRLSSPLNLYTSVFLRSFLLLLVTSGTAIQSLKAVDANWTSTTAGNWSDVTKWSSNPTIPGGAGSQITINTNINTTANGVVTLDTTSRTIGILNIGDTNASNSFNLSSSGGGTVIFDNGGSTAVINQLGNSNGDTISAPVQLSSSLDINNQTAVTGKTLTISTGGVTSGTTGTKTITNVSSGGGGVTFSGIIGNGSGSVAVTQNSSTSLLTLSGANTFTGGVSILKGNLTVMTNAGALGGTGNVVTLGASSGNNDATLTVQGAVTYIQAITVAGGSSGNSLKINGNGTGTGLSGAITLGGHDVTIAASNAAFTVSGGTSGSGNVKITNNTTSSNQNFTTGALNNSGTITNEGTGAGSVLVSSVVGTNVTGVWQNSSTSKLDLSAVNTYAGTTRVTLGTLVASSGKALGDTSSVTVDGGTLDIRGATAGSVTLGSGANLMFSAGSLKLQLGTSQDRLVSSGSGAFTITGGTFDLDVTGAGFNYGNTYQVLSGFGGSNSVSGLSFIGYDTTNFVASINTSGVLSFAAVPEPGTWTLLGIGLMVLTLRPLRRA